MTNSRGSGKGESGMDSKFSRREFILRATAGVGALGFIAGCSWSSPSPGKQSLTAEETSLLGAIADQIIPADAWAGGRDAGVVTFIDIQLAGPYRRHQKAYHDGLAGIADICAVRFKKRFEELPWALQTSLLEEMEGGTWKEGIWSNGFSSRFFEMVRLHCMQGYYGSPRHGGNKNFVSYNMIGLDEPPIVGQNRHKV